ncbi:conserved hypothetical protein [Acidithiobacillus caldus SM-1]|uniref:Uncharacterized protein n=2 Tax=Acidithiobacillus caldus TaxID=33059 RepID=F9ZLD9_ACICS|nr:hypothetical protein [Acidithiobacillus caldus]AEK57808.1 conserved hypothetical protein [Acidithiobacillus caldus SM-1]OFC61971.1 hypothetical protein BAE30_03290 [Acidithiobacillus caldus]
MEASYDVLREIIDTAKGRTLETYREALRYREIPCDSDWRRYLMWRFPPIAQAHIVKAMLAHPQGNTISDIQVTFLLDQGAKEAMAEILGVLLPEEHRLTVGELRSRLKNLPDCMPVFYERIGDEFLGKPGWTPKVFREKTDPGFPQGDSIECFSAFTAHVAVDEQGKEALVVTAHY